MPLARKGNNQPWTYADYLTWPDDERWEIIEGVAYSMSPSPSVSHQRISRALTRIIATHLLGRQCELFAAPFDVRLADSTAVSDNYVETVVQPDIIVVCDPSKIDSRGCNGAPDLIIEITSPSTGKNDLTIKFDLYQRHGVKEYWIVHPDEQTVMVFRLQENGVYNVSGRFGCTDCIGVPLLGDLMIELKDVFST